MNDLMGRLRSIRQQAMQDNPSLGCADMPIPEEEGLEGDLQKFYSIISQVKQNTDKLKESTEQMEMIGETLMKSMLDPTEKARSEKQLRDMKESVGAITQSTGKHFQDLDAETLQTDGRDDARDRMVNSATSSSKTNWREALKGYLDVEKRIDGQLRERNRRHLEMLNGDAPSEEQLDAMEGAADVFEQAMMGKADLQLAKNCNEAAHAQHDQVKIILQNQLEILEMWAQLGVCLQDEHEMLNNIYDNVEQAKAYVAEANLELDRTVELVGWTAKNKKEAAARQKKAACFALCTIS